MTVHAPFNFVTLSSFVYSPDWADRISHDVPFEDGISGEFDITITAHSKLLIGGERGKHPKDGIQTVEPFKLPNGKYAIPESSLRGMIRNMLEIAAFGQMKFVDDKRYGIRDLTRGARAFYGDRITEKVQGAYRSKARAGWLRFDKQVGRWIISECEFARIEHSDLSLMNSAFGSALQRIKLQREQSRRFARCLYDAWGGTPLDDDFWVEPERNHQHSQPLRYRKAYPISSPSTGSGATRVKGTVVFTGQPAKWRPDQLQRGPRGKKHLEFIFLHNPKPVEHIVSSKRWADFLNIHEGGEKASDNWAFWKKRYDDGVCSAIPVFFLMDETGTVSSLGLAMMFKLAHENSVHDMIWRTSEDHLTENKWDLATAIFGEAANDDKQSKTNDARAGLKSRVHMGLARCEEKLDPIEEIPTVLAGPKPSYFPIYVRQRAAKGRSGILEGNTYATYTPADGNSEIVTPEIRGWKRYAAGRGDNVVQPADGIGADVQVRLRPLPENVVFVSTVRFHNLKPEEFGALLWALEWGQERGLYHRIGMGKPYGYGQISISINDTKWRIRPNSKGEILSKKGYVDKFKDLMEKEYRQVAANAGHPDCSWWHSEQMVLLRALANPAIGKDKALEYMRLEMQGANEFADAKYERGREYSEILPEYVPLGPKDCPKRDHYIWPWHRSAEATRQPSATPMTGNAESLQVGDIVIDQECRDLARILAIREDKADIQYLDDDAQEYDVPLTRLRKSSPPSGASSQHRRR